MSTTTLPNSSPTSDLLTPPFHPIPNISNLRDPSLLPLPTPHGPIKPSILYRSASISALTPPDWLALSSLNITHVFDLRSAPEVGDISSAPWIAGMSAANISRTWVPVFTATDYSPEGIASRYEKYMSSSVEGFVSAYRDILANGGAAYEKILRYLIDSEGKGVLVHCTAGKDRTGIFFGVLFDFLGVDREKIAEEYNLTELGLSGVREEVVKRLLGGVAFRKFMAKEQLGRDLTGEEVEKLVNEEEVVRIEEEAREKGRQAALRMVGAKKETMVKALEMVDRDFGGAERYLREKCGLSEADLERLRGNLVGEKK